MVLKKRHEVRSKRPGLDEIFPHSLVFGGRDVGEPKVFRQVSGDRPGDLRIWHLHPVVEESVEKQSQPIAPRVRSLEVDLARVHAMNLLVRLRLAVPNRDDEDEEVRMLLRDLRQQLDEVECPRAPRELLRIRESVVPSLELVEDERGRRVLEEFEKKLVAGDVGLLVALAPLHAPDLGTVSSGGERPPWAEDPVNVE